MGALTFTAKDEPGIGFRIGYTYLSERARRRANRVSGAGIMLTGVLLILLSFFLPMPWLMAVLLSCFGVIIPVTYLVAKREYELEELSEEAPEKPERKIRPPRVGKYLALQTVFVGLSLVLLINGKLPDREISILIFVQLFLLALTVPFSQPLVFQLAPKFKGKMALGFAKAMTVVSAMVALQLAVAALKPKASPLLVVLMLLVSLGAIFYAVFVALTSAYEEGYY
ncbi:Conserved hypothetical protein [Thermococcus gammatolerans EJ3]|uniref:Uncharacterized protein n=2 Tax=Thermococcus TaxID=2263 RepID=C5A460_THEGJ|nr:Conserved hypothetical protein [Thermococcus gammatolerans EJ3]